MGKVIAFWGNVHGQPRTTSNMVAVAIATALLHNRRCLLMQTHFNLNHLETYLIGNRENSRDVFLDIGIDGLARSIKLEPLMEKTIENYSIPLLNKKLALLPGTTSHNRDLYKNDMGRTLYIILKEAVRYYDYVFVDINSGSDQISEIVIKQSDLIAVNLCQNKSVLDDYFTTWQWKNKNIMYLIGSYDKNSSYNINNLKNLYRPLRKSPVSEIPYSTGFMDAQSNGSVLKFMNKSMALRGKEEDAYFIGCVRKASERLLKLTTDKKGGIVSDL